MAEYIYWRTSDWDTIEKIRRRFGIPKGITLNGETRLPPDFDFEQQFFEETRRRGFFDVRHKDETYIRRLPRREAETARGH